MKTKVLNASFYNRDAIRPEIDRLAAQAQITHCSEGRTLTQEELIHRLPGHDIVIAADEPYTERVLDAAPQLVMIARDGVGVDSIDMAAATRRGVIVNRAPVVHDSVADLVWGHIIAAMRRFLVADRGTREGRFNHRDDYLGRDVHGSTLGLLGFGMVARAVAKRACGFSMTLLTHAPHVGPDDARELGVESVEFDMLLARSDILSVHVALTPDTAKIIDAGAIAKMKDGAYLINTSRGAVIDEPALIAAIKSGKLAGAGLDVVCDEPPNPDNPLFQFQNVLFTPHIGSDTFNTLRNVFECVIDDILLLLADKKPQHVYNPQVFEHERFARGNWPQDKSDHHDESC